MTGTEERLATGDAVNVAARLEQAAQPGEILVGEETLALVRDAVETERGRAARAEGQIRARFRLPASRRARGARARPRIRFVGRERELELCREAWQRVLAEQRCELVTVLGNAGVGKSRLAAELLASVDARVVRGRCLSYGEGITYWPVVEVLKQLDALPSDPAAAAAIRSLLGESEHDDLAPTRSPGRSASCSRSRRRSSVVFDDIQWGEETFLDLVEHVALLSSARRSCCSASLVRTCSSAVRTGRSRSALEPLADADAVDELIRTTLPAELRDRIAHAAGGNPLFLTEMLAMATRPTGDVVVPPTLAGAARRAPRPARRRASARVLERGAVEGEIFHRGAVQALPDGRAQVDAAARGARPQGADPARPRRSWRARTPFASGTCSIRDAAYDALPKAVRAELHERFADWLDERGAELVELDEILGFHLEQAAALQAELGETDREFGGARRRATGRRGPASSHARRPRGEAPLLERALVLHAAVVSAHRTSRSTWRMRRCRSEAPQRLQRPPPSERGHWATDLERRSRRVVAAEARLNIGEEEVDELERRCREALPLLEQAGDHVAAGRVWLALGYRRRESPRTPRGMGVRRRAGHPPRRLAGREPHGEFGLPTALLFGPRPADEALRTLDGALAGCPPRPSRAEPRRCSRCSAGSTSEPGRALRPAVRLRELTAPIRLISLLRDRDLRRGITRRPYAGSASHLDVPPWSSVARPALLSTYAPILGRSLCELVATTRPSRSPSSGASSATSEIT